MSTGRPAHLLSQVNALKKKPSRNGTAIQIMCMKGDFSENHLFLRELTAFSHLNSDRLILENSVMCDIDLMNFTELGSNWVSFLDLQTL